MNNDSDSGYLRDYLDFDIKISEGGSRGYAVAVRSPAGEAQEEMSFPFDERQLRDKLKDLEIALLRSGGTRRQLSYEEQTVQEFGRSLFEATLVGKVSTCYYRSMDQVRQQGKEVQSGKSVSVTVSSGFSTSKVPDLRGKLPDEARNILDGAGLKLGTVGKVPSDEVAENKIVKHYPTAGSEVKQGTSVRVTVADKQNEERAVEEASKHRSYPKPDTLPGESELEREVESSSQRSDRPPSDRGRKVERPQDLPE